MAQKLKRTRPELKRQRDMLARFERYLPMLKLKQQQLQMMIQKLERERESARQETENAKAKLRRYEAILSDIGGINLQALATYTEIKTSISNIAGVDIPIFKGVVFPEARYSLFGTAAWVDAALADMREISRCIARQDILDRQYHLLQQELTKIIQRVNLFEKVKIPETKENIRRIRIQLGDEMAAAVARAKIAKGKLTEEEVQTLEREVFGEALTEDGAER